MPIIFEKKEVCTDTEYFLQNVVERWRSWLKLMLSIAPQNSVIIDNDML